MKRIALVAAIFAAAACGTAETPATDTTTPAMAPVPASDTGMKMDSMKADSARADTGATKTP